MRCAGAISQRQIIHRPSVRLFCREGFQRNWDDGTGLGGVDISRRGLKRVERPLFSTAAGILPPPDTPAKHPRPRDKATVAGREREGKVIRRAYAYACKYGTTLNKLHFHFSTTPILPPFLSAHPAASMRHVVETSPSARCPRPCPR